MSSMESGSRTRGRAAAWVVLTAAVALVVVGGIVAELSQSVGGSVSVH